jgi:hypothetical protein
MRYGVPRPLLRRSGWLSFPIGKEYDAVHLAIGDLSRKAAKLRMVAGQQSVDVVQALADAASTDKKNPPNLMNVHVVMKLTKTEPDDMETFMPEITEFANTQNPIKGSDLQANKLVHRRMEVLARETMCPGAEPRQWFYERTRGAYQAALAHEGTTAKKRLEFLERIPSTNRFDKTDLAVFHMAWLGRPDSVSRGPQKNFVEFTKGLASLSLTEDQIDLRFFRQTVAKAIVYDVARKAVAQCGILKIPSSVTAYLVAYFAHRFGDVVRLGAIWENQAVSEGLRMLFARWAPEINATIVDSNVQDRLLTRIQHCYCGQAANSAPLTEIARRGFRAPAEAQQADFACAQQGGAQKRADRAETRPERIPSRRWRR